jgi:type I restriction enzyme, S subunit
MREGWEIKKLGEVLKLEYGKPLENNKRNSNGKYPIYGANGEKGRTNEFYYNKKTIIVGRKGSAGEVNLTDEKFWPLDVTYFVTFNEKKYDLNFLFHLLNFLDLTKLAKGVKPGINRNEVYSIDAKFPPLPEQQRIVAILDEAFAAIAKAKANAEQNLKNAKELFESYLQGVFENKLHGSKFETLDSLCELIIDCEHKTAPTQKTGYPSIRTPNIGKGVLILEGVNRVSEKTYTEWTRRAIPQADDLILAREAPAGNIAVIPENIKVCLGQRTVLIRPKKNKIISKFLAYLILSKDVQEQLLSHSTGATVQHINVKDIRAFKVFNLAPLSEQQAIVKKLDALSAETKKLEAIYQKKTEDLEELKKAFLEKAFRGELSEQDFRGLEEDRIRRKAVVV